MPSPSRAKVRFALVLALLAASAAAADAGSTPPQVPVTLAVRTEIRAGAVFVSWRDAAGERDLAVRIFLENEGKVPLDVRFRAPTTPGEILLGVFGMDARQGHWAAPLPVSFAPDSEPTVDTSWVGSSFEACVRPLATPLLPERLPVASADAPPAPSAAEVPVALSVVTGLRTGAVFAAWADEGGQRTLDAIAFLEHDQVAPLEFTVRVPASRGDLRLFAVGTSRQEFAFGHLGVDFALGATPVVDAAEAAVDPRTGRARRFELSLRR